MEMENIKEFIRTQEVMRLLDDPNITSVGIGYKQKKGKLVYEGRGRSRKKKVCVQFTVERKLNIGEQPETVEAISITPIPKNYEVDGEVIETDVLERLFEPAYLLIEAQTIEKNFRKKRQDPLVPGISISHVDETAGTLGCFVFDAQTNDRYMLSNWHVLKGAGGEIGDDIVQPGPFDDADTTGNKVGSLVRSHLGLAGDCAIASAAERDLDSNVHGLETTPRALARAELDDRVIKSGRTTGVTNGIVTRVEVTSSITYDGVGTRQIGGFEIGPDPAAPAIDNEISKGGDSGSIWFATDESGHATDIAIGLHFAGERSDNPEEFALACNLNTVLRKMSVSLTPSLVPEADDDVPREGYDEDFLGSHRVSLPWLVGTTVYDALEVDDVSLFDYHHFSLAMNRKRRFAIYTAHNIDGLRMKTVSGGLTWKFDDRIKDEFQAGNDVYVDNPWDRGHLVRRAAVVWGSLAEARRANRDTYHYTNAAPQHQNFNRDEWVHLEDWVLDNADDNNYRACVFTGPVFTDNDEKHRGIGIPAAYWKIVVIPREQSGGISVTSFLMNQYDFLEDQNGRKFIDLRVYQVALETIEYLAGLEFEGLSQAQPQLVLEALAAPEALVPQPWNIISTPGDIVL